jgi:hypothetical protein
MTNFVEECRGEWKRLGVPKQLASDMAAELAADLQEGASPEDVLGSDAGDAAKFAREWAVERGVQPRGSRRLSRAGATAVAAFAAVAIAGAALLLFTSPSRSTVLAPVNAVWTHAGTQRVWVGPPLHAITEPVPAANRIAPAPIQIFKTDVSTSSIDAYTAGLVLLIVGVAGLVPTTLLWWSTRRRLDAALGR